MAKNSEQALTGLLQIPIVTSRTGPMKRLVADLHDIARQLDQARNAIVRAWLRWREDHPDWRPPQAMDADGKPKLRRNGDLVLINPMHPMIVAEDGSPGEFCKPANDGDRAGILEQTDGDRQDMLGGGTEPVVRKPREKWRRVSDGAVGTGFETWLYHVGRAASPNVAAILIAQVVKEVLSNLSTDVQHHGGPHKFRWQAVLANDEQAPSFRMRNIPVPNNSAIFCYGGIFCGGRNASAADHKLAEFWGKSAAVLSFPLFAGDAGREVKSPVVTLNVGAMSPGNRQVLAKVARGEWKWSDSKIVHKKGKWQIQFTYRQPSRSLGLNPERIATVLPQFPEGQRPFVVEFGEKSWQCGNGLWLSAEFDRLDTRRKRIRERYKVATSGVKGHGRKRFESRLKPWARKTHDCQRHFTWQLINEIVRFCKANDCGSVIYREPSLGIRDSLWLAKRGQNGVPFDWTGLSTNLVYKLRCYGIVCTIDRINGKELRERFGGSSAPEPKAPENVTAQGAAPAEAETASRGPEAVAGNGHATVTGKRSRFRGTRR